MFCWLNLPKLNLLLTWEIGQSFFFPVKHEASLFPGFDLAPHLGEEALALPVADGYRAARLDAVTGRLQVGPEVKGRTADEGAEGRRASLYEHEEREPKYPATVTTLRCCTVNALVCPNHPIYKCMQNDLWAIDPTSAEQLGLGYSTKHDRISCCQVKNKWFALCDNVTF